MHIYIETENGVTKNHPAFYENLIQAFGSVPEHWEPFTRVERPVPAMYQTMDSEEPTYEKVVGVWTDVWSLRNMTVGEKAAKQQAVKDAWAAQAQASNFTAWTFDEATCSYKPPIPHPAGGLYGWVGATNSWVLRS